MLPALLTGEDEQDGTKIEVEWNMVTDVTDKRARFVQRGKGGKLGI